MYGQLMFDSTWKIRYTQMLVSCGMDSADVFMLIRGMALAESLTQNDVCTLTENQSAIVRAAIQETYPDQYDTIMANLGEYIAWRKFFSPYESQPLKREELLNSKEMEEIIDAPLTPEDLEKIIVVAFGEKTINIAAPGLCLAWMGYETPDMVLLKGSDFDFEKHMLHGINVPEQLWRVLERYHNTNEEKVPNKGTGRWIYKIPGEWFIRSTTSKGGTKCQVDPAKMVTSIAHTSEKYQQVTGKGRKITVRLTQTAGMLYRLYKPWETFTDEQFVDALRFKRRSYDTYQMQRWKKKFTAYCLLREMREAT